jgi:hypothetical protein
MAKNCLCAIALLMACGIPAWAEVVPGFDTTEGTKLADGQGYASLVRLEHQTVKANNGKVLIAFERSDWIGIPVYESLDDGDSWHSVTFANDQVFKDNERCQLHWQPNLIELPRDSGPLKKGTLLLSGNTACRDAEGRLTQEHLQVYASTDLGRSWTYRGTIVDGGGRPEAKDNHGVWEPNLVVLNDGRMVAFYSTEQHKAEGFNQLLAHKISTDGGASWGDEINDTAVPGGVERPGMAAVISLPDRRYAYTYEDIDGPENNGQVFIKFSKDGLDWGDPADRGWPVHTMGGAWPAACPQVAWLPVGGPNGVLIVSAERAGGAGDAGGRSFYWNNDLGRGPWWEIRAPVQKRTGNIGAGWTQVVMLKRDGRVLHVTSSSAATSAADNMDSRKNVLLFAAAKLSFNRYEAEDAARRNAAFIRDDAMSNRGRVRMASGGLGQLDFDINVAKAGRYPITLRFTAASLQPATPGLSVNGARVVVSDPPPSDGWTEITVNAELTAGYNRITVTGGRNAADIDYVELGAPVRD